MIRLGCWCEGYGGRELRARDRNRTQALSTSPAAAGKNYIRPICSLQNCYCYGFTTCRFTLTQPTLIPAFICGHHLSIKAVVDRGS